MSALRTVLAGIITAAIAATITVAAPAATGAGPLKEVVHSVRGGDGGGWCC